MYTPTCIRARVRPDDHGRAGLDGRGTRWSEVELVRALRGELEAAMGAAVGGLGGPADAGGAEGVHGEQGTGEDALENVGLRRFELDESGQHGQQVDELGGPVRVPHVHVEVVQRRGLPVSYTHLTLPTKRIV